jgi:N-methylhydantoinase B
MSGGGGYGDPLEGSPDLVLRDVLDGKVTVAAAQREYGVVVNVAERTLDREATADLRERRRATAI